MPAQIRRTLVTSAVSLLLVSGLSACGTASADSSSTSAGSHAHEVGTATAADAGFAESMIPHHEQAVEMSDLALKASTGASAELKALALKIKNAQGPEIDEMEHWLEHWELPGSASPGASGSESAHADGHSHSHGGHGSDGHSMPGMMSEADMTKLRAATGPEFDRMWLTMMIAHHEGAIEMSEPLVKSSNEHVSELASKIIDVQKAEITQMRAMLAG